MSIQEKLKRNRLWMKLDRQKNPTKHKIRNKNYYLKNKSKLLDKNKNYRKQNREKCNTINRNWYQKNLMKCRENAREKYKKNKKKILARFSKYSKINREKNNTRLKAWRNTKLHKFCYICGSKEKLHRHHEDYKKPFDITTLCCRCHFRVHKNLLQVIN
jgi:hypothetical protein